MPWKVQEATGLSQDTGPTHTRVRVIVAGWMDGQTGNGWTDRKTVSLAGMPPLGSRKC